MPLKSNYCKAIVIAHGKSEMMMAEYIKSNLRLNIKILTKDKGRSSIQVNGLLNFINSDFRLKNLKSIENAFLPEIIKKQMFGCKIFTIMDLDDCSENDAKRYKSGEMFENCWLKDYIIPIWCSPNFDISMKNAKVIENIPNDKEKGKTYTKVFPISHSDETNLGEIREFRNRLIGSRNTNLKEFVDYCIEIVNNR